jgi:hypothetical protein
VAPGRPAFAHHRSVFRGCFEAPRGSA